MDDARKDHFKDLLQQLLVEYNLLHDSLQIQIQHQTAPVPISAPQPPGLVEISGAALREHAGHPEQHPDTQMSWITEARASRTFHPLARSISETSPLESFWVMKERIKLAALEIPRPQTLGLVESSWSALGEQAGHPEQHPGTQKPLITEDKTSWYLNQHARSISETSRLEPVRFMKERVKPAALEIPQSDSDQHGKLVSENTEISKGSLPSSAGLTSTLSHAQVPPTPVASISPIGNRVKHGAIKNPNFVKETVMRIQEELDTHSVSTISKYISKASFKEDGLMAKIAKSKAFEACTMVIVLLNSIWVAIDADHNRETFLLDADPIFQVAEHFFCVLFCLELAIRFAAFRNKREALSDPWFIFDSILLVLLVSETWIMTIVIAAVSSSRRLRRVHFSILRLLRVVRLARLARVMRAVPELGFMIKGVLQATRSVTCTLGLLLGILYVFGIALKQFSEGTHMGEKHFKTVPLAVFTLFAQGALLDNVSILFPQVYSESLFCAILLLVVVILTALTLMNMLIGVLCDVMNRVASMEKDRMAVSYVKEKIRLALAELDTNMDGLVDRQEFTDMLCNEKASEALKDVGVDVVALVDFADYYFQSDKHGECFEQRWSFDRFIEELMQLRGVNAATVKDTVELRKFIHSQNTSQNAMLKHLVDSQSTLARNQVKLEHLILHVKCLE